MYETLQHVASVNLPLKQGYDTLGILKGGPTTRFCWSLIITFDFEIELLSYFCDTK